MSYSNKFSDKPFEKASKIGHTNIINDNAVKEFIKGCHIPLLAENVDSTDLDFIEISNVKNPIKNVITIDGGYTDVIVKSEFPSSTLAFFQFGALFFKQQDLSELNEKPFIDPEDFSKLQNIQRIKLVLPTKGIALKKEKDLVSSVRRTIYDFFISKPEAEELISALKWLVFEEYTRNDAKWVLSRCPSCGKPNEIDKTSINSKYSFNCNNCNEEIFLTDLFRLHEVMDNEIGANGILGYLSTVIEQLIIVFLIKKIIETKPTMLEETLIIKDGPLAFFGQTANMHKPMRKLMSYLNKNYTIYLVGLEKSGSFVEHAEAIKNRIPNNNAVLLNNKYIYKYIIPGYANDNEPYGSTTYYGNKIYYKSKNDNLYVATIPTIEILANPKASDLINMQIILNNISNLKCDLYYNSLLPIVLANKLVSLADHPSSDLLKHFAQENID